MSVLGALADSLMFESSSRGKDKTAFLLPPKVGNSFPLVAVAWNFPTGCEAAVTTHLSSW